MGFADAPDAPVSSTRKLNITIYSEFKNDADRIEILVKNPTALNKQLEASSKVPSTIKVMSVSPPVRYVMTGAQPLQPLRYSAFSSSDGLSSFALINIIGVVALVSILVAYIAMRTQRSGGQAASATKERIHL